MENKNISISDNGDKILDNIDKHNEKIVESNDKSLEHIAKEIKKDIDKYYGNVIILNPKYQHIKYEPKRKSFLISNPFKGK